MAGLVRAESPVDELAAFEWASEIRFEGSVRVHADSVSLVLDGTDGFWERSMGRTGDLDADLARCFDELAQLRARPPSEAADLVEAAPAQPIAHDGRDAASA